MVKCGKEERIKEREKQKERKKEREREREEKVRLVDKGRKNKCPGQVEQQVTRKVK